MGSYGIGVSRAVAAVAEQTHDEIGLCWPREIAPADIHIVATGKEEEVFNTAEKLATDLEVQGIRVMFDDRKDASAGVKFKDAELIGIPFILIVGKGLAEGKVELKIRKSGEKQDLAVNDAPAQLVKLISNS
jgi:prolyl-tRNA synthetase